MKCAHAPCKRHGELGKPGWFFWVDSDWEPERPNRPAFTNQQMGACAEHDPRHPRHPGHPWGDQLRQLELAR